MTDISNRYLGYQYGIDGLTKIATNFYPLEKTAKIGYRIIDMVGLLKNISSPFQILTSQLKDLILVIESTRFFCVSIPLFLKDKEGRSFFQIKTPLQSVERVAIVSHLALKTLFGADRVGLIRLGIIGSYAIGYIPIFRWILESSVLLFNICGALDGAKTLINLKSKLMHAKNKIKHWHYHRKIFMETSKNDCMKIKPCDNQTIKDFSTKHKKWKIIKNNLEFERSKAWFKIGATIGKCILIVFAVGIAAVNISTASCVITILSLGIISDGIGLAGFFHQAYYTPFTPPVD